jgi:hypothetical protein
MCAERIFDAFRFFLLFLQLPLERAAAAVWDLCCVVPSQHGELIDLVAGVDSLAAEQGVWVWVLH